jgi:hypothetical protein
MAHQSYFANKPHRYGRQLARVFASHYEEIVSDCVLPGNLQLNKVLRPLMEEAEMTLDLDYYKRSRTVLRIDGGGGSLDNINWLLKRGYQIHSKDCSRQRAAGMHPLSQNGSRIRCIRAAKWAGRGGALTLYETY